MKICDYVFGRFTGLLPYFTFSLVSVLIFFFDKNKKYRTFIFLSIMLCIFSYTFMAPDNYQGGGGALGNRFFMGIFPSFLFLVQKIKSFKLPIAGSLIGLSFIGLILIYPLNSSYKPYLHALSPVYNILPIEYTLLNTLPTLIQNDMIIIRNDKHIWYRIHKFDENSLIREYGSFWIKGERQNEFAIRIMNNKVLEYGILNIFNGCEPNIIKLDLPSGKIRNQLLPGETQRILFPLKKFYPYFYSRVYPFKFYSSHGFIPSMHDLHPGELSDYYLGFSFSFNFNFSDIAKEFYKKGDNEKALKYSKLALERDPYDIIPQNLIYRIKGELQNIDHHESLYLFLQKYIENNMQSLIDYNDKFSSEESEDDILHPIKEFSSGPLHLCEILSGFSISFPLNELGASTDLIATEKGINLTHDSSFSVQTPRVLLNKGLYRVIFNIIPSNNNYNDEQNPLTLILDANSRFGTVHESFIIDKFNDENIYSLDIDLIITDSISFRLTSFNSDNYILKSINLIPIEPLEYYMNYLNHENIEGFIPEYNSVGIGYELLNYNDIRPEDEIFITNFYKDLKSPEEIRIDSECIKISNDFAYACISNISIENGHMTFNSSLILKKNLNSGAVLNLKITQKGFFSQILRRLRIRRDEFRINLPVYEDHFPPHLLPKNYLLKRNHSIEIPDHFNREDYEMAFSLYLH